MDSEQSHISQYDPATTNRVLGETAQVLRAIGFASHHAVLIGGVVPGMLVPDPPRGLDPHAGTTDIDLCLSIALVEGETGEYERIETEIRKLGFDIGDQGSFQWQRKGDFPMTVEFFCPASEDRPVGMFRPRNDSNPVAKHNFGSRLSAFALNAGELIVSDVVEVPREVVLPATGDRMIYTFRVTGIVGFLCAKTAALYDRSKYKDPYDIVWLLEAWDRGAFGAGSTVRKHLVYEREDAVRAMEQLVLAFQELDSIGPRGYARFLTTGDMTADEIAGLTLRAQGAVEEFRLALLG